MTTFNRSAAAILVVAFCKPAYGADVVDEVINAWRARRTAIATLSLSAEVKRTESFGKGSTSDPFALEEDTPAESQSIVSLSQLRFSKTESKLACTVDGQSWNVQEKRHVDTQYRAAYNGSDSKWVNEGSVLPMGGARINIDQAEGYLTAGTIEAGAWLAVDPLSWLARLNFDVKNITISNASAVDDSGTQCVEVTVPRDANERALILVDPNRSHLLLKLVNVRKGVIVQEHTLTYGENEAVGWGLQEWQSNYFNDGGVIETAYVGTVDELQINQPISNETFELAFAPGTHYTESVGKSDAVKYYIQLEGGKRKEVTEGEFGLLPPEDSSPIGPFASLPLLATVAVIIVLAGALIRKRSR